MHLHLSGKSLDSFKFLAVTWLAALSLHLMASELLNQEKMFIIDGKPRFVLGLYENPREDAVLSEAVQAGFNLIQCSDTPESLDRVQRAGAKAWVNLGGALDLSLDRDKRKQKLADTIRRIGHHPALLVWEGPDEILWNNWWSPMETLRHELRAMGKIADEKPDLRLLQRRTQDLFERGLYREFEQARSEFWSKARQPVPNPNVRADNILDHLQSSGAGITLGIRAVREWDSDHLIWLNHAPRNSLDDLRLYNRAADVVGCDIYPAPANLRVGHSDLIDMSLGSVGAYTERMRAAAPDKACAMVLQGFGWRDLKETPNEKENAVGIGRRPTFNESRFMAYDAILHGANALLYWGTAYLKPIEDDGKQVSGRPKFWNDLLRIAREIRALEPALIAKPLENPAIQQAPTYGSIDGTGVICSLRQVQSDFVLLVANEAGDGLAFAVRDLPPTLNGKKLYRLHTNEESLIQDGTFSDGIRSRDVHVYSTSRRFESLN